MPFFALSGHDLRGYESGRYRDRMHLASEVEYRRHLWKRISGAVFGGVGEVVEQLGDVNTSDLLWNGGAGVRFRLTKDNPLHYRIDLAVGQDGWEYYFSIGEEF